MRKRVWWLGAAGIVIVLPLAAIGLAVTIIDPNDYKPQLIAAVQEATGRALTMNGPLRISRSLWPTIEVSDVQLANLPGGSRADIAHAERIEAQLSLPALLWRRIEVMQLTLIGPNILFEVVNGKPNWAFDVAAEASANPAPATPGFRASLRFLRVHVQNGMVTFKLPARTKVVGLRTLDFQRLREGGPLKVESVLVYGDYAPFSLKAAAEPTAGDDAPWNTRLDFAAYDTTAIGTGTMSLTGGYDLQVDAKMGALEKLNALLPDMRLPALHDVTLATHLTNTTDRGDVPIIGATKLHFASADLSDRLPGLTLGAVDLTQPAAGQLSTVAAVGSYAGQPFTAAGKFGIPAHPDGKANWPLDMTVQAKTKAAGSVAVKGKLALNAGAFDGLDAAVAVRAPALSAFRTIVSPRLPALTDVALDSQVVIPSNHGSAKLTGMKLATHEGELVGDATIGLTGGLVMDGKLHAARLDLDAMLAAFGIDLDGGSSGDRAGSVIPNTKLSWAALRGPVIDLTATIGTMLFKGDTWSNLDLALQLKAGRLQVALPGAPLDAALTVDAATDTAPVSLSLHAPSIPLAVITNAVELPGHVSGTTRIDAKLHAVGRSLHEYAASLDGSLALTMTGGSLTNAALLKLTATSLDALSIKVPAQGETTIHCLGVIGAFSKGIGRFSTIALDTTYLELDGAGQVDLGAETLALKLNPLAQVAGSAVAVPVLVEGPFRALSGRLDASGLDKVGLLIDGLFGGDQPETCSDAGLVPARPKAR